MCCWEGGELERWESSEPGRREKRGSIELERWERWEESGKVGEMGG